MNDEERINKLERKYEILEKRVGTNENSLSQIWNWIRIRPKNDIYIGKMQVSKTQVIGLIVSLSLGLANSIRQSGNVRLPLDLKGYMESLNMEWINPEYLFMVFLIWPLGIFLKHRSPISNGLIPRYLFLAAVLGCAVWGWKISPYIGGDRWFDAILRQGIVQGFFVSSAAAKIYDIKHGGSKNKKIKLKKEEVV